MWTHYSPEWKYEVIRKLTYTPRFEKHFESLTEQEKRQVKKKLEILTQNPLHPSLRTKRIQGTVNLFECSVNMSIRIIWYCESDETIILVDIGLHNIFRQF
jgi:mRNA-degrading endonuclease YafQ of YafQ-DinJ toxin-antitoxin module